jgi:pimeloyl-ACP methyl ester carboxylesterase
MKNTAKIKAFQIRPMTINGLRGRMMVYEPKRKNAKRDILLIYGHHSSLERMQGIIENIAKYGRVTAPDLPGFGGMDSFYKINKKPTLDNMADYLATFIKLKYKNRPLTVCALSFGSVVVTKMLQKYPEITEQIDIYISMVGFTSKHDFKFKKRNFYFFRYGASLCSTYLLSQFAKHVVLRGPVIRLAYKSVADKHVKMKDADEEERDKRINFEIHLWQCNDIRTYMDTSVTMLKLDITKQKVNMPVIYISVDADQYFDNKVVKTNLKKVFKKVTMYKSKMNNHAPTVVSSAKEAEPLIPKDVRMLLSKKLPLKR